MPSAGGLPPITDLTEPERRDQILRAFSVPGYAGIFVLGAFASRVTFYSQQVRALNLVDALCKSGVVRQRELVAVIGAGASGLTAAAALAVRGARVRLFESRASPRSAAGRIPLQQSSRQRALHPHLYDWPFGDDATKPEAGLPVLDWEAGTAAGVANALEKQFEAIRAATVDPDTGEPAIQFHDRPVTKIDVARSDVRPLTIGVDEESLTFAAVILAVGFGVEERDDTGWHSYWADDSLDSFESAKGRWLISGFGDGALTDLLRLCVVRFDHQTVISSFLEVIPARVAEDLAGMATDLPGVDRSDLLDQAAARIELRLELRDVDIFLNCTRARLFGGSTSVLNRLMVACLLRKTNRIQFLESPGKIRKAREGPDGKFVVERDLGTKGQEQWQAVPEGPFDGVVVRHGPRKALEHGFPTLWKASAGRRTEWNATPPSGDWTRQPQWEGRDFAGGAPPLVRDFRQGAGCVVVTSREERDRIATDVENALYRASKEDRSRVSGLVIDSNVTVLYVEDALSDTARYEHAVRTISGAQVAVFDLGDNQPGVAFLLGIRSVARRGLSLIVRRGPFDADLWEKIPFNLREISIVSRVQGDNEFIEKLRRTIVRGARLLEALPESYLDLPAFDAVRRLGYDPDMYRSIPAETQALVLSWFTKGYLQTGGNVVARCLRTALGQGCEILTMMSSLSPQLTSQKLYAEIRRTDLCVVDWTGWRLNVMFEFGVRVASNKYDPLTVSCNEIDGLPPDLREELPVIGKQHAALRALFAPFEFGFDADARFRARIEATADEIRRVRGGRPSARRGAALPYGFTYRVVQDSIDQSQEPWSIGVVERLRRASRQLLGSDLKRYPDLPVLFEDAGKRESWRSGVEHLIAGWYYLDGRHHFTQAATTGTQLQRDDPRFIDFLDLSREILSTLETLGWEQADAYRDLCAQLEDLLRPPNNASPQGT